MAEPEISDYLKSVFAAVPESENLTAGEIAALRRFIAEPIAEPATKRHRLRRTLFPIACAAALLSLYAAAVNVDNSYEVFDCKINGLSRQEAEHEMRIANQAGILGKAYYKVGTLGRGVMLEILY